MFSLRMFLLALVGAQIVTKGDLEGVACSRDEHNRYRTIVCGETLQNCELEWCKEYIHNWKLEFGACNQLGCDELPAEESNEEK